MKRLLVSALRGRAAGRPVLVLGGGPSVLSDLEHVPNWQDMLQISANDHGFKIPGAKPAFIFCKDHRRVLPPPAPRHGHGEFLEPVMRKYGVPIVSQQYWADYRCAEWPIQGNSGMMALALGAFMHGAPVIAVGMDCFQGPTYFHDPAVRNVSNNRTVTYWYTRMQHLRMKLDRTSCPVRAVSGIMARAFERYDPKERVEKHEPHIMMKYRTMTPVRLRLRTATLDPRTKVEIPAGTILASWTHEAGRLCKLGIAELDSPSRVM